MADIKLSGMGIVALNGSVGSLTYTRNKYGDYVKTKPGAPAGSPSLTAWQMNITNLTIIWQTVLTDTERQLWIDASSQRIDDLAMNHTIAGYNLFMSLNLNSILVGGSSFPTPPPYNFVDPIKVQSFVINMALNMFLVVHSQRGTPQTFAIYATKGLPPGRMSTNQTYAYLEPRSAGIPIWNITPAYVSHFGAIVSGLKYFVKCIPISLTSGQRGVPVFASFIAP